MKKRVLVIIILSFATIASLGLMAANTVLVQQHKQVAESTIQTDVIPGLSVKNIYSVLESAGYDEFEKNKQLSGTIDDKVHGEYLSVNIITCGSNDKVSSVNFSMWSEPNISPTIGGILPHNPTIDLFFSKVASVSYSGADPMKAFSWAYQQFNNTPPTSMPTEIVIGPAKYKFDIQAFNSVELIYSLKISLNKDTPNEKKDVTQDMSKPTQSNEYEDNNKNAIQNVFPEKSDQSQSEAEQSSNSPQKTVKIMPQTPVQNTMITSPQLSVQAPDNSNILVPSVCGNSLEDARKILEQNKLNVVIKYKYSPGCGTNIVYKTDPDYDSKIEPGGTVTIFVSPTFVYPNVKGKSLQDALNMLKQTDMTPQIIPQIIYVSTAPGPAGIVIGQSPPAGEPVQQIGSGVDMVMTVSGNPPGASK